MIDQLNDLESSIASARTLQSVLAGNVILKDGYAKPLRTIAGFNVGFEDSGATVRAAAVLLDADTRQLLDTQVTRVAMTTPYIPGMLSLSTLPALLLALKQLAQPPDLLLIEGHGIAHPRGLGIAAHFGVASGLPSIGVAGRIIIGAGQTPHPVRGAYKPLRYRGAQIGWLLRSKLDCEPLVVSPGHHMSMASAADLVMRYVDQDRWPEPMRLAAQAAARDDAS
ncbi:MAG: endonuclease V [Luteimonas sp.]